MDLPTRGGKWAGRQWLHRVLANRLRNTIRKHYRGLTLVTAVALATCAAFTLNGQAPLVDGTLYDLSTLLCKVFFGHQNGSEPVALIALDRDSLASEKFKSQPRTSFGNWFGEMAEALIAADVRVVGFDILF